MKLTPDNGHNSLSMPLRYPCDFIQTPRGQGHTPDDKPHKHNSRTARRLHFKQGDAIRKSDNTGAAELFRPLQTGMQGGIYFLEKMKENK